MAYATALLILDKLAGGKGPAGFGDLLLDADLVLIAVHEISDVRELLAEVRRVGRVVDTVLVDHAGDQLLLAFAGEVGIHNDLCRSDDRAVLDLLEGHALRSGVIVHLALVEIAVSGKNDFHAGSLLNKNSVLERRSAIIIQRRELAVKTKINVS